MLSGVHAGVNRVDLVITELRLAPFTFHLTGSRCFKYHSELSDWDFFVGIPPGGLSEVRQWLTEHRFTRETNSDYIPALPDPLDESLEVWVHRAAEVHVQIVRDADSKAAIQEAMKKVPGMREMLKSLSKDNRKAIWRMGRAVFESGKLSRYQKGLVV